MKTNDGGEKLQSTDETLKQRGSRYGSFAEHAKLSQTLKEAIEYHIQHHGHTELMTPSMYEAIGMICHKLARIANGDPTYDDSWRDISGYSELIVKELNGEII